MSEITITEYALIGRLVVAGILGAVIGLEREFRAKEAGLRTHFLVGLGSALFMIVSQYGFAEAAQIDGLRPADSARVAAQIVTGIGFIGAGAIMVQRHYVRGLTTAAGLWVVAAIGMSAGAGLYVLAVTVTVFALIGLEIFRMLLKWVSLKMVEITFRADSPEAVERMLERIRLTGCKIAAYKISCLNSAGIIRVTLSARDRARSDDANKMFVRLSGVQGAQIESIE